MFDWCSITVHWMFYRCSIDFDLNFTVDGAVVFETVYPSDGADLVENWRDLLLDRCSIDVPDIMLTTSWCSRCHRDDILMYPPSCWRHLDVSDVFVTTSWCIRHHVDDILMYPLSSWRHLEVPATQYMFVFLSDLHNAPVSACLCVDACWCICVHAGFNEHACDASDAGHLKLSNLRPTNIYRLIMDLSNLIHLSN